MKRSIMAALALLACGAAPAQEVPDEDAAFDRSVRNFGYSGGAAWQCSEGAARDGVETQALAAYNGLVRLFGTEQAFYFAASFGAGTTDAIDRVGCAGFVDTFTDGMARGVRAE